MNSNTTVFWVKTEVKYVYWSFPKTITTWILQKHLYRKLNSLYLIFRNSKSLISFLDHHWRMKFWRSCPFKSRPVQDNVPVSRLLLLLEIPMVMLALALNAPKRLPPLSVEQSFWPNCPLCPFVVVSGETKLANPTPCQQRWLANAVPFGWDSFLPLEELELCPHLCPRSFCKWLVLRIATRLLVVLLELWAILVSFGMVSPTPRVNKRCRLSALFKLNLDFNPVTHSLHPNTSKLRSAWSEK